MQSSAPRTKIEAPLRRFWAVPQASELRNAIRAPADLSGADLVSSDLFGADLSSTDLRKAALCEAKLATANLRGANLAWADLFGADLSSAVLNRTTLSKANLSSAILRGVDLSMAALDGTSFHGARVGYAIFANLDLSEAKGLETVIHEGPSSIGIDTIYKSKGKIPHIFLRGVGVPENFIEYMASLVGTRHRVLLPLHQLLDPRSGVCRAPSRRSTSQRRPLLVCSRTICKGARKFIGKSTKPFAFMTNCCSSSPRPAWRASG